MVVPWVLIVIVDLLVVLTTVFSPELVLTVAVSMPLLHSICQCDIMRLLIPVTFPFGDSECSISRQEVFALELSK